MGEPEHDEQHDGDEHHDEPQVVSHSQYAMDAATYRHPEDVQSGVFDRQAEAQHRR